MLGRLLNDGSGPHGVESGSGGGADDEDGDGGSNGRADKGISDGDDVGELASFVCKTIETKGWKVSMHFSGIGNSSVFVIQHNS